MPSIKFIVDFLFLYNHCLFILFICKVLKRNPHQAIGQNFVVIMKNIYYQIMHILNDEDPMQYDHF